MALVPIFHGRIDGDGRLILFETERRQRRQYLQSLADQMVEIVVRRARRRRSEKQNAYWHAVPFPLLADALGYSSLEELKFDLLGECFGWVETKGGRPYPRIMHTSDLTTEEGSHFTEWLVRFGALLPSPVLIPLPDEAEAA